MSLPSQFFKGKKFRGLGKFVYGLQRRHEYFFLYQILGQKSALAMIVPVP